MVRKETLNLRNWTEVDVAEEAEPESGAFVEGAEVEGGAVVTFQTRLGRQKRTG